MPQLSPELFDRSRSNYPFPMAEAIAGLESADSVYEQRDRIVEVFRTVIRLLATYSLAVRVQFGTGPDGESPQLASLMNGLRRRGLTDGQWVAILRELLREWKSQPEDYPIPQLVLLFHRKRSKFLRLVDGLLAMRKAQTVAHGRVGSKEDVQKIIEERIPQLEQMLVALEPIWQERKLGIVQEKKDGENHTAGFLHGLRSIGGRLRPLGISEDLPAGKLALFDAEGKAKVFLFPLALWTKALPENLEELMVFEKRGKRGALFLGIPSMLETENIDAWKQLQQQFFGDDQEQVHPDIKGIERPFRGLESFLPKHHKLFFGREDATEEVANRIRSHGFLTLTGPSGCGKSSLLQAGVIPLLQDREKGVEENQDVRTVPLLFRPGGQPLQALASVLSHIIEPASLPEIQRSIHDGRAEVFAQLLGTWCARQGKQLILIVDQGEELLTLCQDAAEREVFAELLTELGGSAASPLRVVISLREDFFGPMGVLTPWRSRFTRQVVVLSTPDEDSLKQTLYGPLTFFGFQFEDHELLDTMIEAVKGQPAALALLQFCADRMWDRRDRHRQLVTWEAYNKLGGVEGALATHAENTLQALPTQQKALARNLFLRLVTEERTRQVCPRTELIEGTGDPEQTKGLLDALVTARLLTVQESDSEESEPVYELIHEALIRHWGQLKDWLLASQESQRTLVSLRSAAREWEERGKPNSLLWQDELLEELHHFQRHSGMGLTSLEGAFAVKSEGWAARKGRLRRGLIGGALIVSILFGVFMFWQWQEADKESRVAIAQRLIAGIRENSGQGHDLARAAVLLAGTESEVVRRTSEAILRNQQKKLLKGFPNSSFSSAENFTVVVDPTASAILMFEKNPRNKSIAVLWRPNHENTLIQLTHHTGRIQGGVFSSTGRYVALWSDDYKLSIWDTKSGYLLHSLHGHRGPVSKVQFSVDEQLLISSVLETSEEMEPTPYNPSGIEFAIENSIAAWSVRTGNQEWKLSIQQKEFTDWQLLPDGKTLLTLAIDQLSDELSTYRYISHWSLVSGERSGVGEQRWLSEGSINFRKLSLGVNQGIVLHSGSVSGEYIRVPKGKADKLKEQYRLERSATAYPFGGQKQQECMDWGGEAEGWLCLPKLSTQRDKDGNYHFLGFDPHQAWFYERKPPFYVTLNEYPVVYVALSKNRQRALVVQQEPATLPEHFEYCGLSLEVGPPSPEEWEGCKVDVLLLREVSENRDFIGKPLFRQALYPSESPKSYMEFPHQGIRKLANTVSFSSDGKYLLLKALPPLKEYFELMQEEEGETLLSFELLQVVDTTSGQPIARLKGLNTEGTKALCFSEKGSTAFALRKDCPFAPEHSWICPTQTPMKEHISFQDLYCPGIVHDGQFLWDISIVEKEDSGVAVQGSRFLNAWETMQFSSQKNELYKLKKEDVGLWFQIFQKKDHSWKESQRFLFAKSEQGIESHSVTASAISADGSRIALVTSKKLLIFRRNANQIKLWKEKNIDHIKMVVFSPRGDRIAIGMRTERYKLWNFSKDTVKVLFNSPGQEWPASQFRFSPSGERLALSHQDNVYFWDMDGEPIHPSLQSSTGMINEIAFSRDGTTLAVMTLIDTLEQWDLKSSVSQLALQLGEQSAVRPCRESLQLVSVYPKPPKDSTWAPAERCRTED